MRVGYVGWVRATQYLSGAGEHAFTGVQTCTTGILNLLDLRSALADDGAHARVGDHELDRHCTAAGDRGLVEGLVVDPANDEAECLKMDE